MAGRVEKKIIFDDNQIMFTDIDSRNNVEEELKSAFVGMLKKQIRTLGLTQTEAAAFMGIKQPDVSRLVNGRTERFTLARVFAFVRALGGDVEITVKGKPATGEGKMRPRVALEAA